MDYVTRQFINLAKKLRKELRTYQNTLHHDLTCLSDGLKDLKNTVNTHQQADAKSTEIEPPISVTELRTQVPISVQTHAKRSKIEGGWRVAKGFLEVIVAVAVIGYTWVSYENWQEQIDATNFVARQTELGRKGLNETVKNFRMDQRPWIGMVSIDETVPAIPSEAITVKVRLTNSGKTPGLDTHVSWETDCEPIEKRVKPSYTERTAKEYTTVMPGQDLWLTNEDKAICSPENRALIQEGRATIYAMGTIWYHDEFHQPHTTDFCTYIDFSKGTLEKLRSAHGVVTGAVNRPCRHYNHAT
ncbi:MAG: hypothetical protein WA634_04875 [Silvibacterium sp.]